MRIIEKEEFKRNVKNLLIQTHYFLPEDVILAIKEAIKIEEGLAKDALLKILKNAEISSCLKLPLCQDTGIPQFFLNIGKNVYFDFNLKEVLNEIVTETYNQEKFRKSSVEDPLFRRNNFNFFTFFVDYKEENENECEVSILIRGGGSENMSRLNLFLPTTEFQEIIKYIINEVKNMLMFTCPPVVVSIGLGGSIDTNICMTKKALLRKIGERNKKEFYAETEIFLKQQINLSNIGPLGLGGKTTVLDVFIETLPTHIATLPVSINLQCHSYRRGSIRL
ncbi:MAG: fumarate hydratase [Elusimicrobiota bacterium]|nr:fumarate hydratase [Endomicrobiia bacterium]MDW8165857.1 fumarate hydratase [Elusimicrobiota bacterium]